MKLALLWDPGGYTFWLLVVSAACWILERCFPWRREQRAFRRQIWGDFFWLAFNGHFAGVLLAVLTARFLGWASPAFERVETLGLLGASPLWLQFGALFLLKDWIEWCGHNLLHRVPWLWEIHKLHHSIEELDWIGNFRFHWLEIVVYRSLTYLPLVSLGADGRVLLAIAVLSTLLGHLNHANLNLSWGPLRYALNSPRMHVWHHQYGWPDEHPKGANFGIALSAWDWLFGTAYWPKAEDCHEQQPKRLGFPGMERFPSRLLDRLVHPLSRLWGARTRARNEARAGGRNDLPPPALMP